MKRNSLKFFSLGAILVLALVLMTSCGSSDKPDYEGLDFEKYVKLGNYKGIEYTPEDTTVTDEEVKAEIDSRLQATSTSTLLKEGVVESGDTVNVAYIGKIDGKAFQGGSTESSDIVIGETPMIEGFVEGLIGKSVGETVELNLKFPDDYHAKEVAGKDVVFTVTINGLKVQEVPQLTDEWVQTNSKLNTVIEFETQVRGDLEKVKKNQADQKVKGYLWQTIFENSKVKEIPKDILAAEKAKLIDNYKTEAKEVYNISYEDYLKNYLGQTPEEFDKTADTYAKSIAEQKMLMYAIAKKENLSVSEEEYQKHLKKTLKEAGFNEKTFKDNYKMSVEDYAEKLDWRTSLLYNKVTDKMLELGKVQ